MFACTLGIYSSPINNTGSNREGLYRLVPFLCTNTNVYSVVQPHLFGPTYLEYSLIRTHIPNYKVIHLSKNSVIWTVRLGTKVQPHLSGLTYLEYSLIRTHIPNYKVIHLYENSVIRTVSLGTKVSGLVRIHCTTLRGEPI